jgi:hypothetical protein
MSTYPDPDSTCYIDRDFAERLGTVGVKEYLSSLIRVGVRVRVRVRIRVSVWVIHISFTTSALTLTFFFIESFNFLGYFLDRLKRADFVV